MNNAHVFIARLVRRVRSQARHARSVLSGRVLAFELPSLASGFLRSCRNDGGRVASVRGRSCS